MKAIGSDLWLIFKGVKMELFKKHVDAIIVLSGLLGSLVWMNAKFNKIEKDLAVIKTVLVMKNILPAELAKTENKEK